jgi:hypothetical protein
MNACSLLQSHAKPSRVPGLDAFCGRLSARAATLLDDADADPQPAIDMLANLSTLGTQFKQARSQF